MTQSFTEWLNEKTQSIEIPTINAKTHARELEKMGIDAEADAEGLIVYAGTRKDKKKIREYLMDNGWDERDLDDGFPELRV